MIFEIGKVLRSTQSSPRGSYDFGHLKVMVIINMVLIKKKSVHTDTHPHRHTHTYTHKHTHKEKV